VIVSTSSTGGTAPGPAIVPLLVGLVDDAAVFPPGSAALPDAVAAHRVHRAAWYADLIGPLLLPATALRDVPALLGPDEVIDIGVIGDVPIAGLPDVLSQTDPRLRVRQVEAAVAKRGEDPAPGLGALLSHAALLEQLHPELSLFAEAPLTWGLFEALDVIAAERTAGVAVAPKFRTGGLAAELFPTPVELAAVICACRDRALPFKLTAGLHHAIRHPDPETGFTHHGFLNIIAAVLVAADGAEVIEVAEVLGATDPVPLIERVRPRRDHERPLWRGFGSCSVTEPLDDLARLGLVASNALPGGVT
jgi:hypothetical protein